MLTTGGRLAERPPATARAGRAKRTVTDLAVFGGPAAFREELSVGRPTIGDRARLLARIGEALDRRWLSNDGPLVREFERRVAQVAGVRHAVATNNATIGLQLAIRAAELTGEVIVPAMTFAATAHAVRWLGLDPVFCDVDPATGNLSPAAVEAVLTPRTTGIIGVHLWGRPCPVRELEALAAARGLTLLFDSAHAIGVTSAGRPVGGFGSAEVFSFHATKVVNAFEGGAVLTDDDALAERVRSLRNFGFDDAREVQWAGTNGKMAESSAAMGLTSLEAMPRTVAHNRMLHHAYRAGLAGVPALRLAGFDERETNNYQYAIVEADPACGLGPDDLLEVLRAEGVVGRRYFAPGCHQMRPYRTPGAAVPVLPHTEALAAKVLALPTGTQLGPDDARVICDILRVAVDHGPLTAHRVRERRAAATPAHAPDGHPR
ncbi:MULTISPECIES: aminotransferase class I/II-fold pyridoxal phosphate-dependent enzyme [unclassified Streptomyces]|uniref:aminotransferase class I/II-fold pyridoxal phosphate-dependent enzyme n=1 Tax=unclassified Streptomyces TaxID=2593676 RepID=UPI0036785E01